MSTLVSNKRVGVVLFQLGGPDSLEAVEPFLTNLVSDPDIIDLPLGNLARTALARLIARHRAEKVRAHYAAIGGKSPIVELTQRQASALEDALCQVPGIEARTFVAMRYWHPTTEEALASIAHNSFDWIVLLPLYPQYSCTTTGSSFNEWERQFDMTQTDGIPVTAIRDYHDHPGYIEAIVEKINDGLLLFPRGAPVHLVFSAHGIPVTKIESGDPYCQQVEETTRLVLERGGWQTSHTLCYQSKVGPGRWAEPTLKTTLSVVRDQGQSRVLIIPVSFVTDHVETLYELEIEARRRAEELKYDQFEVMPALNDSPLFINALQDLVLRAIGMNHLRERINC